MPEGLLERLNKGPVICAEGYLFEAERRGYLSAGEFVPQIALEHPEVLGQIHRDFRHAGSDVVQAFTYNGHREKMRVIGKEALLEPLNRNALKVAKSIATEPMDGLPDALVAGNISNTNIWDPANPDACAEAARMFEEMAEWAADEGADFIIGETFYWAAEAEAALAAIRRAGLPAVIMLAPMANDAMQEGMGVAECSQRLEAQGAAVVGMNCFRGPETMWPLLSEIRAAVSCPVAALPVPYRTTAEQPTFFNLDDPGNCQCPAPHGRTFPTALDPLYCNRYEIRAFAERCLAADINFLGVCCGASPIHIREIAEACGRTPPASRYRERMENHFMYGSNERIPEAYKALGDRA
jgi:betaine-homocysteine S-methyltransferase